MSSTRTQPSPSPASCTSPPTRPPSEPLPLLVVHDGPEYADLAQLLRYVTTLVRTEPGLRCRVLLLDPIDRDRSYSASPGVRPCAGHPDAARG